MQKRLLVIRIEKKMMRNMVLFFFNNRNKAFNVADFIPEFFWISINKATWYYKPYVIIFHFFELSSGNAWL